MNILDKIFAAKKIAVEAAKANADHAMLFAAAKTIRENKTSNGFSSALRDNSRVNIIAEFKRRSPSKGIINASLDPARTAKLYANGGAAAMSVLTEDENFGGSIEDLKAARSSCDLPILRKDFIFDRFQIIEAAAAGADAILLIAAMLDDSQLIDLKEFTEIEFGMDVLLEVHNEQEMERALSVDAKIIGVNNRNLSTFEVSLDVSRQLIKNRESDVVYIAESGISDRAEIDELRGLGFSGFLIGETLMRSNDPAAELKKLTK
jgi:indole-3-glycerol phosphate synthase